MSSLHTISRSPQHELLEACLKVINPGDEILFIEDGVYSCCDKKLLSLIFRENSVYGLREDLVARGLRDKQDPLIEVVGYHKFVELTVQHSKTVSWF
jgi:tRNA 2-thiouridine synthesizing protein B